MGHRGGAGEGIQFLHALGVRPSASLSPMVKASTNYVAVCSFISIVGYRMHVCRSFSVKSMAVCEGGGF